MRSRDGSEAYPEGRTDRAWARTGAEREHAVEKASSTSHLDDQGVLKTIHFSPDTLHSEASGGTEERKVAVSHASPQCPARAKST